MTEWRPIPGWEKYEASRCGKVRRIGGVELRGHVNERGYSRVSLSDGARKRSTSVHRLVAETFIANPLALPQVNHKDGVKLHNGADNLEWVTAEQNRDHAFDTGLNDKGAARFNAKLTDNDVREIRRSYIPRHPEFGARAFARRLGVDHYTVCDVIWRRRWKHVADFPPPQAQE